MTPTREEMLQAELEALKASLPDIARKARDAALEEAAKIASVAADAAERRRVQAKEHDNREWYIVAEGQWDVLAPVADDIRALKSKP